MVNKLKIKMIVAFSIFIFSSVLFFSYYNVKNNELNIKDEHIICEYIELDNI